MAAADAPYEHLPMELGPPYYTRREGITSNPYGHTEIFLIRLVLRRWPTYATTHIPTVFRQLAAASAPTEPFPWRYGRHIAPSESKSTLLHKGMGRLCWIWLVLGFQRYPYADFCLRGIISIRR